MRISFGQSFDQGLDAINHASEDLARHQQRVATGRRFQTASEDPAGTAVAIGERATLSTVGTYERTGSGARSRLAVADAVLGDMVNQLTTAKTTAAGARNSARTPEQLAVYAAEIRGVAEALYSNINSKFGSTYLFAGTAATQPYTRAGSGYSAYSGNGTTMAVDIANGRSVQVTFDGSDVLAVSASENIFQALESLAVAIQGADTAGIAAGMAAIDTVFSSVVTTQTQVGVGQRTLEEVGAQLTAARLGGRQRLSQVEDVNMAEAISDLRQAEVAHEATLGAFATLARVTLLDYLK